jgi:serine/threonine-protein kinase RsbW
MKEVGMSSAPDVELRMPAVSANIGLTRLVAAALGSQADLVIEDIDELRMAVDELCYWLIGASDAATREFLVIFSATPGSVEVRGTTVGDGWRGAAGLDRDLSALSRRILDALADEYSCAWSEAARTFSLLKLSRS